MSIWAFPIQGYYKQSGLERAMYLYHPGPTVYSLMLVAYCACLGPFSPSIMLFSVIISRQHKWGMALQASGYENLGSLFTGSLALCLSVCVSLSFFSLSVSLPFIFPHHCLRFLALEVESLQVASKHIQRFCDRQQAVCQQSLRKWGPPQRVI
jgi:uncharacterized membrane protein